MREGSNLSILKEAKKNYMGQLIFSRGVGIYLLIPFFVAFLGINQFCRVGLRFVLVL